MNLFHLDKIKLPHCWDLQVREIVFKITSTIGKQMMACNKLFMMHNIGINDFLLIDLMNGMKEMQYNTAQYFLRTDISYFALILLYSEGA